MSDVMSYHHHHNRFTALFPGPARWDGARRELLDFMVQGEINRGRHTDTDHPAGWRHSIRTNQYPPLPSLSRLKWNKIILAAKIILFHFRRGSVHP